MYYWRYTQIVSAPIIKAHDFLPQLDTVKEEMQQKPFEDLLYKMKSEADSSAFLQFINVLKEMTGG